MADDNKNAAGSPPVPPFKKFGGAKLVPPPAPIQQLNGEERFPVFLGVGIVLSVLVLVAVFVLSFTSAKKKAHDEVPPAATPAASASVH